MGDYGFFDFDDGPADFISYPRNLALGSWEVTDAWALDQGVGDRIATLCVKHTPSAGGLGVALVPCKEAAASDQLHHLLHAKDSEPTEEERPVRDVGNADPFVVLLQQCTCDGHWNAAFGRAQQHLERKAQARKAVHSSDEKRSRFWIAAYTANDGRYQLEMGLGSYPDGRIFRAKFGEDGPLFTHISLAGLKGHCEGDDVTLLLEDVNVETGLSLDPPKPAGVAQAGGDAEAAEGEGADTAGEEPDGGSLEGGIPGPDIAAAASPDASLEAAALSEVDLAAWWPIDTRPAAAAPEEELPEEAPVPSWRWPGGSRGRPGGVLLDDEDREALLPSLDTLLERLDADESGRPSASTCRYDPRPSRESVLTALAIIDPSREPADAGACEPALELPAGGKGELLALADHPFIPLEESAAEVQRRHAEGLRERQRRLRQDRAKRREERLAELRRAEEPARPPEPPCMAPKNLGIGGGRQGAAPPWQRG